ncbi:MAG: hypothetical protein LC641_09820 [Spirochaeta sp.]|nr:hypothetical protein [Spirochaeta sp.]
MKHLIQLHVLRLRLVLGPMLARSIFLALCVVALSGCSSRPQGVVLIDPYLAGVLSDAELADWRRAASSEGLKLDLVHLQPTEDAGTLFDQMRSVLASGKDYHVAFVTPVLLREAELLAELSEDLFQGDVVVLGVGADKLPEGLRGVEFDRLPAYRELGALVAERSAADPDNSIDSILFLALDTPENRSGAAALGSALEDKVGIKELWYSTEPNQERIRRDIDEWKTPNTLAVFALGSSGAAALQLSREHALPSVFEGSGFAYEHVMYSIELPFCGLLRAAVRGEPDVPAVLGTVSLPSGP